MKAPNKIYVEVCEDGIFAFPEPPFKESVEYIRADLVEQPLQQEQPQVADASKMEKKEQKPSAPTNVPPIPSRNNEHKPAEWSEKDEKMFQRIIRHTESEYQDWCNDKFGHSEIVSDGKRSCLERLDWLGNRLKSLRPQPHWRPSEYQVNALKDVIDRVPLTCRQQTPLELLLNDLELLL
jgi:hypothetical protein